MSAEVGLAELEGLHDVERPPVLVPQRQSHRRRNPRRPGNRHSLPCHTRLDEPRRKQGWTAARQRGRGRSCDSQGLPACGRDLPSRQPLRDGARGAGALLAVQRHARFDARERGLGPQLQIAGAGRSRWPTIAHPSCGDARRRTILPGNFRQAAGGIRRSLGWTGDDVWHAHCVHMSAGKIALFARTGTGVARPSSNMRLASGIAPVKAWRRAGVRSGSG